ncbi:YciI family protein [Georgenia halophila]|uniref:YciI family protein n=1 Tax=Georgenia halophila TaxID=620889 RepID=A0ABP8LB62_9MICO
MRVMVMIEGAGADEDKITPTTEMFEQMNAYNEELVKAGVMVGGDGLRPSSNGARVVFDAGETSVVDGPFTESKEVIAGYWLWQVKSLEEAVEWAKRCPSDAQYGRQVLEIRPLFEEEDFGDALTPELKEKERALADQIEAQHGHP